MYHQVLHIIKSSNKTAFRYAITACNQLLYRQLLMGNNSYILNQLPPLEAFQELYKNDVFIKNNNFKTLIIFDDCQKKIYESQLFDEYVRQTRHFNIDIIAILHDFYSIPQQTRFEFTVFHIIDCLPTAKTLRPFLFFVDEPAISIIKLNKNLSLESIYRPHSTLAFYYERGTKYIENIKETIDGENTTIFNDLNDDDDVTNNKKKRKKKLDILRKNNATILKKLSRINDEIYSRDLSQIYCVILIADPYPKQDMCTGNALEISQNNVDQIPDILKNFKLLFDIQNLKFTFTNFIKLWPHVLFLNIHHVYGDVNTCIADDIIDYLIDEKKISIISFGNVARNYMDVKIDNNQKKNKLKCNPHQWIQMPHLSSARKCDELFDTLYNTPCFLYANEYCKDIFNLNFNIFPSCD
ncbi:hypothetical protein PV326_013428 [Microctonus aethiopoides]|nr:hypothetical protein PV326_013428 [Microctonus aethiopoides]